MSIQVRSNEPAPETKTVEAPAAVKAEGSETKSVEQLSAPEARSSEQKETSESEPEGKEATKDTEEETQETEAAGTELKTDEPESDKAGKKKGGFQRRIDKLNARVSAKEQEAEYWRQQALKGASEPKKDQVDSKPSQSEGKPNVDDFTSHADFVEKLTDWKTKQALKEHTQALEQSRLQTEQANAAKSYSDRAKAFLEKHPDFNEVLADIETPLSATVKEIIVSSEMGPELAYELAKNPEEFERVCKLPPLAAAREMGKLESRLTVSAPQEKKTELKKITKAPNPVNPVGTGGKGAAPKSLSDPTISQAEYEKLRAEQMKKRRQAG